MFKIFAFVCNVSRSHSKFEVLIFETFVRFLNFKFERYHDSGELKASIFELFI